MTTTFSYIYSHYLTKTTLLEESLRIHQSRNRTFIIAEMLTFILGLILLGLYAFHTASVGYVLAAAIVFAGYWYIRRRDQLNDKLIEEKKALLTAYQHEKAYLMGDFHHFNNGSQYINTKHAYTYDLDIFGEHSLFQRINRTVTTGGSDCLAQILQGALISKDRPKTYKVIHAYVEASKELAAKEDFLMAFKAQRRSSLINTAQVKEALTESNLVNIPRWMTAPAFHLLCNANLVGFYISIFLSFGHIVPAALPIAWGIINVLVASLLAGRKVKPIMNVMEPLQQQLNGYARLVALVNSTHFDSALLQSWQSDVQQSATSIDLIDRLLQSIVNRSNEIGILLFNAFSLIDFRIVRHYAKWQHHYNARFAQWLDLISQFDAMVSMATLRMNEPDTTDAEWIETEDVVFEAEQLYHPFLGADAVKNNFDVFDSHYYIITGANMAGKSTFLRAVGINYVLACCGMPVFADSLAVSVFQLFTSMRTTDDLSHGISYFNAELLRLQQLIEQVDLASAEPNSMGTLVILDEILKGTNSLDKLNGSRLFLEYISTKNVTGIIATHDLELSRLSEETGYRFVNFCFEIELGTNVTYPYTISKGVARNQNATYLLRQILTQHTSH